MEFVSWLDFHGFIQSKGWQLEHTVDELTVNSLDGTQNFLKKKKKKNFKNDLFKKSFTKICR